MSCSMSKQQQCHAVMSCQGPTRKLLFPASGLSSVFPPLQLKVGMHLLLFVQPTDLDFSLLCDSYSVTNLPSFPSTPPPPLPPFLSSSPSPSPSFASQHAATMGGEGWVKNWQKGRGGAGGIGALPETLGAFKMFFEF
eukprot:766054-Hanusia_phi.AAC.5